MITTNQLIRNKNVRSVTPKKENRLFGNAPFRSATCVLVTTMNPKKPNSANRRVAKVKFNWNKKEAYAYIPGEKHPLQVHSKVLVKQGGRADLPGVRCMLVRGWGDLPHVVKNKTAVKK